jgi:heat shock protein HtpX
MWLLLTILFGIVYALISVAGFLLGVSNFVFFGLLAVGFTIFQYLIGPSIVGWSMRVKYVDEKEEPWLHETIEKLAKKAGLPKPRIGVSPSSVANAFAFGRWKSDGRVCVTQGIMHLMKKNELEAVLGHEISHLKNRDVVFMTVISVIPLIAWYLAWSSMFSRDNRGSLALLGIFAFVIYFITNFLVRYASRIREYYADAGSVALGHKPHDLASALYKLVYSSAKMPKQAIKQVEGVKAFFANDISNAHHEIVELQQLDLDKSGHIDEHELKQFKEKHVKLGFGDKLMEAFSTHPNMLKRIKRLSEY